MYIIKRDGKKELVKYDKITTRIRKQTYGLNLDYVEPLEVAKKVIQGVHDGVTSVQLDNLAAETAAGMTTVHPDYSILASRIAITSLHKTTKKSFVETMEDLYSYNDPTTGNFAGMIDDNVIKFVRENVDELEHAISYDRDFFFDYFGFKTLEKSYLLKINEKVAERPQHLWMRVSCGIWAGNLEEVIKTYDLISKGFFTHATPTLFNAGTRRPQLSSCFLIDLKEDSIEGIFDTLKSAALISKNAGGIGIHLHKLRGKGAYIKGTNGTSNGIVPFLRIFNETARAVDQGGGKRKGSIAIYLEPWHSDINDFLNLRKNHGYEEMRARDLFIALWISDLFMKRVEENAKWTLFSPDEAPHLADTYGDEFEKLYTKYEEEGRGKEVSARELWERIMESQIETGTPYMLYKDNANKKNNQKNLGTLHGSNLCTEIMEYTAPDEIAVCNLASIALPKYIEYPASKKSKNKAERKFNHDKLYDVAYQITKNLNKVIDVNFYPVAEARNSNMRHRPIGIGIQGLADTFAILGLPFASEEAKILNKEIHETIYFASMTASADLAAIDGAYKSFKGSPISQGIFQFDMWGVTPSSRWDWDSLREKVKKGVRNSLLLAPMPTASTSQILGNNECFEPFTSNLYSRRVLAGEYVLINKHLVEDLINRNLWDENMRLQLLNSKGSIANIAEIPDDIKEVYKTVWEIKQRDIIDMSADRGAFICQSQSLNLFIDKCNAAKLTTAHFYAWKKGLKTGMYYLRTKAATEAIAGLGLDLSKMETKSVEPVLIANDVSCSLDDPDNCEACGS